MLAIDWNARELRIVVGKAQRGKATLLAALRHEWPAGLDRADASATGAEIRKALDAAGLRDRDAVACVERRSLVLKRIALPDVAENETYELLRLQALRDLTIPVEQAVIDHLRVPASAAAPYGQAILAVLQRETLEFHQKAFEAAGLRLLNLWPGSLARAESARVELAKLHSGDADGAACQALLVADDRDVEVIVQQEGRFLASVARPIVGDAEQAGMLAALRRASATLSTQLPQQRIVTLLVSGSSAPPDGIASIFAGLSADAVVSFDPLSEVNADGIVGISPESRGGFAGTVGAMLLAARAAGDRIDFLHPKRPALKVDLRRPLGLIAAGIVVACGLQTYRFYAAGRDKWDAVIKKSRTDEATLARQLKGLRPRQERANLIADWHKADLNEMEVLDKLFRTVAATDRVSLTSIAVNPAPRREEHSAAVSIEGLADSQTKVSEFLRRLSHDDGFEIRLGPVQPGGRTGGTPLWRFTAELLAPVPKSDKTTEQ